METYTTHERQAWLTFRVPPKRRDRVRAQSSGAEDPVGARPCATTATGGGARGGAIAWCMQEKPSGISRNARDYGAAPRVASRCADAGARAAPAPSPWPWAGCAVWARAITSHAPTRIRRAPWARSWSPPPLFFFPLPLTSYSESIPSIKIKRGCKMNLGKQRVYEKFTVHYLVTRVIFKLDYNLGCGR